MRLEISAPRRTPCLPPLVRLLVVAAVVAAGAAAGFGDASAAPRSSGIELAPVGYCPHADEPAASLRAEISGMRCLVNYARTEAGLSALSSSTLLREAAMLRAHGDVRCDQFSHTPCGTAFTATFRRSGYLLHVSQFVVGENLAYSAETATPRSIMLRWLRSPDHRANILDPRFSQMGLILFRVPRFGGYRDVALWVNDFGRRVGGCEPAPRMVLDAWVRTLMREPAGLGSRQGLSERGC
jgi:uncharacterized protein YkwD